MEVAGPLGTPLGLAQRLQSYSHQDSMVLYRGLTMTQNFSKALGKKGHQKGQQQEVCFPCTPVPGVQRCL